ATWVAGGAPPPGGDDGDPSDTGVGDEGHDPPPDHGTGSDSAGDLGTSGVLDDGGDGSANDEGGDDDGSPGGANVLPPGYGLGGDAMGCGCTQGERAPWLAIVVAPWLRRRRRHGT